MGNTSEQKENKDIAETFEQNILMKNFSKTDDIVKDMRGIIESSRNAAEQI